MLLFDMFKALEYELALKTHSPFLPVVDFFAKVYIKAMHCFRPKLNFVTRSQKFIIEFM